MKIPTLLLFAVMMISSGAETARAAALRHGAAIEAPVVRLGDIFIGTGDKAHEVVATAPAPGRSETFTAHRLRTIAAAAGLDWVPGSRYDRVVVERVGRPIPTDEIVAALHDALVSAGAPAGRRVALSARNLTLHAATDATVPFRVADVTYDARTGRFGAVVELSAGDRSMERVQLAGNLYDVIQVPVLARVMQRGDVIRDADVDMVELPRTAVPRTALLDRKRVVGQSPRRLLRASAPLNPGDLRPPVVVPKGSLVTLMVRTNRMLITAQGKALEDGAAGEVIRVLNTRSRTTIEGKVSGPGKIAVAFPTAIR
jgi:flagella basal body P-ring formation protein FlgA